MFQRNGIKVLVTILVLVSGAAQAKIARVKPPANPSSSDSTTAPPAQGTPNPNGVDETCLDHGKPIDIINDEVLHWKTNTPNQFLARARIEGTVDQVFPDHSGHRHFSLKIGPGADDHIEVIYNLSFGQLPVPKVGDAVEACGDYITSSSQTGSYPASPDGAIIHWVHRSPSGHDPGYVILDGVKY